MWDGFDKRKFPRMNLTCEIAILSTEKAEPIKAVTENVGIGGVCVLLNKSLERFSQCGLLLTFGEGCKEEIRCNGRVMWIVKTGNARGRSHHYDIGIEFQDLPEESKLLLKRKIDDFSKKQTAGDPA